MRLGGRHVGGLNGPKKAAPLQRFQRRSESVGPMPGRDGILAISCDSVPGLSMQARINPDQFAGLHRNDKLRIFVPCCRSAG